MAKQNRHRRYTIEAVLLSILAIAVFSPWGCSRSPLAPEQAQVVSTFTLPNGVIAHPGTKLDETELADPGTFSLGPIIQDPMDAKEMGTFEEEIDSDGGGIQLDLDGEMSYFSVPEDALSKSTVITVDVFRDQNAVDRRITEFHFEPEGLEFDRPAVLSYHTLLKEGDKIKLYWWDKARDAWVFTAEAIVVGEYAAFPITHFSDYKIVERISLGGQGDSE
jgi:hypothetical protein